MEENGGHQNFHKLLERFPTSVKCSAVPGQMPVKRIPKSLESHGTHVGTLNNKASLSHTKHLDNPCPGVQKFSTTTLFENEGAHIELSPPFENVGSRYMVVSNNEPSSTGFTGSNFLRPVY